MELNYGLGLLIAFIAFAVIDLSFVGTTMYFVIKLVKKLLNEKPVLEEITKALKRLGQK